MNFQNVYFINGTAYAGKSTMVKRLAEKHGGIACEENYHDALLDTLDSREYPNLTYTRNLKDWAEFIRRMPDEYEAWIDGVTEECAKLELQILDRLTAQTSQKIFVDTNIPPRILHQISDKRHVLIMLADPDISVHRFFDRPDPEKQFLYRLLLQEQDPDRAIANFRECLKRINSPERYQAFAQSGFPVLIRDESRSVDNILHLVETLFDI